VREAYLILRTSLERKGKKKVWVKMQKPLCFTNDTRSVLGKFGKNNRAVALLTRRSMIIKKKQSQRSSSRKNKKS